MSPTRFPWESAYTGREVTQPCCPEVAANQQHITADIGMAVENYYRATGDTDWMQLEGCELIREIALFAASRVVFNRSIDKYEIRGNKLLMPSYRSLQINPFLFIQVSWVQMRIMRWWIITCTLISPFAESCVLPGKNRYFTLILQRLHYLPF